MIKIDHSKEMPITHSREPKYPWRDLGIGDSFFVPDVTNSFRSAAGAAGKRLGFQFSCHAVIENEIKGVRVWRVK